MLRSLAHCALVLLAVAWMPPSGNAETPALVAGFRGSKIWNYAPSYWGNVADSMSRTFNSTAAPAAVWIVTFYGSNGDIYATFPSGGAQLAHVRFASTDDNERYLTEFDRRGVSVWLQVEPGAASMTDLIDIVLNRYKHHPSVVGFGVDVEWLDTQSVPGGRRPTDQEASAWEAKVRSHDTSYTLFLKHYSQNRMPPSYRGKILFVDDSQQFPGLNSCVNEFKAWGAAFAPNKVAFQFGYPDDRSWWSALSNPPAAIGNALLANVPNTAGLFWVDFTITEVFPVSALAVPIPVSQPGFSRLDQNYPNPCNPKTVISYQLSSVSAGETDGGNPGSGSRQVTLAVYDLLGREVAVLANGFVPPGRHMVTWDATGLPSGMYLCRLTTGTFVETKKIVVIRKAGPSGTLTAE